MKNVSGIKKMNAKSKQEDLLENAIGAKLKAYYEDISSKEVPQHFLDLLDKLDKADAKK
jgi:Anti-sigma factor NepR